MSTRLEREATRVFRAAVARNGQLVSEWAKQPAGTPVPSEVIETRDLADEISHLTSLRARERANEAKAARERHPSS